MSSTTKEAAIEDHALESVPAADRKSWLALSWSTAGIVTSLIQLFFGVLVTFVAGFRIAITAGAAVTIVGALLGWGCGHVAYRSGLSSTVLSRHFGFGHKGSIISSLIFGFMIIGFLAIENALLYRGFVFYFHLDDTPVTRIVLYGLMSVTWVLLTAYGFALVARVSSVMLALFLVVLVYISYTVIGSTGHTLFALTSFPPQWPAEVLASMGATSDWGKFTFCVNVLIGSAGALALVDADIGRYARRSRDIGIAALLGNIAMDIVMLGMGGIIMYAGVPSLIDFYQHTGLSPDAAQHAALANPDSITAAFIIFSGGLGALLMVLAQGKAQVLNTYSASLALSNLFDALGAWRPGRLTFVVLANVIGLVMLYGQILVLVNAWITILGVLTTAFAGVIIADYFIVRPRQRAQGNLPHQPDVCNWAGVLTTLAAFLIAHVLLRAVMPVEFVTTLAVCLLGYPVLRLTVFRPTAPAATEQPVT
jgi:cytosine permease